MINAEYNLWEGFPNFQGVRYIIWALRAAVAFYALYVPSASYWVKAILANISMSRRHTLECRSQSIRCRIDHHSDCLGMEIATLPSRFRALNNASNLAVAKSASATLYKLNLQAMENWVHLIAPPLALLMFPHSLYHQVYRSSRLRIRISVRHLSYW